MVYTLNLTKQRPHEAQPFDITVPGRDTAPDGVQLGFTDYYMTLNGKPFYGVCGEFHYSRMDADRWNDELAKMAMGGVNVVSTYIFWNHHEEHEGQWNFEGNRNLRHFIELCAKHGLYVIVRMGPFDHGEVRNGGIPDWMYGKPYEVRSLDKGFLKKVKDLYEHEAAQFKGLYFKDGGPIIAAQLDNEYMHSSAPWEMTTGISNEWVYGGKDGMCYLDALREIATQAGIHVPFYTSTGWGGSPVPADVLPLWGGYAYRPWLFYSHKGEHPKTDEYIYRNFHSNDCPRNEEFDPNYPPETKPYACCEMGGGMVNSYYYRFILPMKSVDAMANIKIGAGCNVLGYYMFQGGTNPLGDGVYMNEGQTPKRSYDYQAALGEFGQVRESYRRLKTLHYFTRSFEDALTPLPVVIPQGQDNLDPADKDTLRWCVRTDGKRGFVFLNNFQDHDVRDDQHGKSIELKLADGDTVVFDHIGLANEENCILPFNLDLGGIMLRNATLQPVVKINLAGRETIVMMIPDGMDKATLTFEKDVTILAQEPSRVSGSTYDATGQDFVTINVQLQSVSLDVLIVSRETSNNLFVTSPSSLVISDNDSAVFVSEPGAAVLETTRTDAKLTMLPSREINVACSKVNVGSVNVRKVNETRYVLQIPSQAIEALTNNSVSDVLMRIRYSGDIGWLWADSELLNDNFANGDVWEISLRDYMSAIIANENQLVLTITPLKEGAKVNVESAMAARTESVDVLIAQLREVELSPIYQTTFSL